jgi:hypothetical protein
MRFSHILKKLLQRIYNDGRQENALPRRTVLTIERLEDRLSPAVFCVNSLADTTADAGHPPLRAALTPVGYYDQHISTESVPQECDWSPKSTESTLQQQTMDAFFSLYPTIANRNEESEESLLADEAAIPSLDDDEPPN